MGRRSKWPYIALPAFALAFSVSSLMHVRTAAADQIEKMWWCVLSDHSEDVEATAAELAKAAVLQQPQEALIESLRDRIKQIALRCGFNRAIIEIPQFSALIVEEVKWRVEQQIKSALGKRAPSPIGRPTYDSGDAAKCLYRHSRQREGALLIAAVGEKFSSDSDQPANEALAERLRSMAVQHCGLSEQQVASPAFVATMADYVYDAAAPLIVPLLNFKQ